MTENIRNGIEMTTIALLSAGIDYAVGKSIDNLCDPATIPEKIVAGVGKIGISLGCNYCVYKVVHGIMHPNEEKQFPELVSEYNSAVAFNTEVAQLMAKSQVRIEDSVNDIIKKMESPDFIAGNKLLSDAKKAGVSSDEIINGSAWLYLDDDKGE